MSTIDWTNLTHDHLTAEYSPEWTPAAIAVHTLSLCLRHNAQFEDRAGHPMNLFMIDKIAEMNEYLEEVGMGLDEYIEYAAIADDLRSRQQQAASMVEALAEAGYITNLDRAKQKAHILASEYKLGHTIG